MNTATLPMSPVLALTAGFVVPGAQKPAGSGGAGAVSIVDGAAADLSARQGFRVGDLGLTIRYDEGTELTDLQICHHVPNAPAWFIGVCNLHGTLVPVFDLAAFLGARTEASDDAEPTKQMMLVLSHGSNATGVLIDGLPQRLRFPAEQAADPALAPAGLQPLIRGAAQLDGNIWFDLDVTALLDAFEAGMQSGG